MFNLNSRLPGGKRLGDATADDLRKATAWCRREARKKELKADALAGLLDTLEKKSA